MRSCCGGPRKMVNAMESADGVNQETGRDMTKGQQKVALVTGAARGIGKACAVRFLSDGASVVISDVDGAALAETA
ncbi:SDR family NAD(P)-dependent oxidoreductase, partial [Escherichia fergusonii]|uniref:SDR family NAD(P)-dependent oxidoreductase n=1 Tax=Escherichia fergusonii TaxID=564 RepID=UPI0034D3735A